MLGTRDPGAMPEWFRDILARGLPPVSGGDGADDKAAEDAKTKADDDDSDIDALGLADKGKQALLDQRRLRKEATARATAAETKLAELQAAADTAAAAKAKADEAEAAKRGEWEQLAATRESERDAAKADAKSLKERAETAEALIAAQVESRVKALPEKVRKLVKDGADPIATFAQLPELEDLAKDLTGSNGASRGAGWDPKAGRDAGAKQSEAARAQMARRYD